MLTEKLKEITQENHLNLERKLVAKMKLISAPSEYGALLSAFYSFFGGLELGIERYLGENEFPDYGKRRKSSAIAADLTSLGYTPPELAGENELPLIQNKYQALGCLYVIEGSTLGGRMISKMLMPRLPEEATGAFTFFQGYGDQTMPMWLLFKEYLDKPDAPLKRNQESMIIQAANETFLKFSTWFDTRQIEMPID